jgi:hypothetical protein
MEDQMNYVLVFEAFAKQGDADLVPFFLRVTHPVQESGGGGYYAVVECPILRDDSFRIYGADTKQSCELTVTFIRQRLKDTGTTLYDENGVETDIPEIEIFPGDETE